MYTDASNLTNGGSASWGVGLLVNTQQFAVNGPYDAVSLSATDFFYDATGGGTPIEIAGNTAPAFYDVAFANGATTTALISNSAGIDVANTLQLQNGITKTSGTLTAMAIRLGAAASLTGSGAFGATRYVDGYMSKAGSAAFTFPLGNGGIYSPATFSQS